MCSVIAMVTSCRVTEVITATMAICKLPLSPIPLCVIMMMYFLGMSLYDIGYINVIYNKLCVAEFNNFSLCVNSTFTKAHPKLQVNVQVSYRAIQMTSLPLFISKD